MDALHARVTKVERELRFWRLLALVTVGLFALATQFGQTKPAADTIEAKRIIFRDDDNRVRMELGRDGDRFGLVFRDEDAKPAGFFELMKDGPFIMLRDSGKDEQRPLHPTVAISPGVGVLVSDESLRSVLLNVGHVVVTGGSIDVQTPITRDRLPVTRACLGTIETVNKKTGAKTSFPESTLTLFNGNGDVIFQAP